MAKLAELLAKLEKLLMPGDRAQPFELGQFGRDDIRHDLQLAREARRLRLRPLSTEEIRHLENSLPAGRSVSSGFAAFTGFALGLGKALTGVFIYDVITANITEAEESSVSSSGSSLREICLNTGSSSSDITCIVYYTNN